MNRNNLDIPIDAVRAFCQRYHVHELALFGSVLRDDFDSDSDVDVLVEFEPDAEVGFVTLARMGRELSELLRRQVDLVPKGGLKPGIRKAVLASAQVLYAS